jgi:hypothetical protein
MQPVPPSDIPSVAVLPFTNLSGDPNQEYFSDGITDELITMLSRLSNLLSQMTGETTVRHAHRTVSNSGASVSEPEVARPLITPDEVMRLGGSEALIFTSGRPAIRARKLRYYNDPFFKCCAAAPPTQSDRIEHVTAQKPLVATAKGFHRSEELKPDSPRSIPPVTPKPRDSKEERDRQLSFLQFALEEEGNPTGAAEKRERLL